MGMSPRLLRPRASGFNPRSISGLAAWYDASDSSTLYTTDAGSVTAASSPLDISGCALWLDGSDAATMFDATSGGSQVANGGSVARWQDKSGNGRHFIQSTASLRPTLTASARNGLSVVTFDATDDYMVSAASHNIPQPATWIFVYKTPANVATFWSLVDSGTDRIHVYSASGSDLRMFTAGGSIILEPDSLAANSWRVGTYHFNGASSQGRRDGARSATGTVGSVAVNGAIYLGSNNGGGAVLRSQIAEAILLTGVTSFADIARIEKYLAAKWGVTGVHAQATAANDPVGAWLDKSGNGRHATQATASGRPSAGSLSGRVAVAFSGTNSVTTPSYPAKATSTYFYVSRHDDTSDTIFQTGPVNGFHSHLVETTSKFRRSEAAQRGVVLPSNIGVGATSLWGVDYSNNAISVRYNGAQVGATSQTSEGAIADSSQATTLGRLSPTETYSPLNGRIAEFLVYGGSNLSASEKSRVERYLAAKWGIALAPQAANADAQDWINRVYANGGAVSATTATAVNTFCAAVESAALRDRFYRLNLFCGTGLNACLVPLYRNWKVYAGRNLLTSGDNLTLSTWSKSGATASISASERPFAYGPFASVVTATAGTGATPHVANTANNYGYGTVTVSAYLKANGQNTVRILLVGSSGMTFPGGGTVAYANINLSNGTVSNVLAGTTATATSVGNGWYRFVYTCANNGAGNMTIRYDVGGGSAYNPTGSESFFIWGIQSELGSSATDYDPYPLGNATDTNSNFVSGDYAETGASGGLKGARTSSKRLATGVPAAQLSGHNFHASVYECATSDASYDISLGAFRAADNSGFYLGTAGTTTSYEFSLIGNALPLATTPLTGHILGVQTGNRVGAIYRNGASASTTYVGGGNTPSDWSLATWDIAVFCWQNASGVYGDYTSARLGGYSVGVAMTAQQVAAYNTAMQAFQTALTRNV